MTDASPDLAVVDLTDPDDLRELHATVLTLSFPPNELLDCAELVAECAAGQLRAVGVRRNGRLIAGAVGSRPATLGGVTLLVYLALAPGTRGGGIGGRLLDEVVRRWVAHDSPALLVAEAEHPGHHKASFEHGDPVARLRFYARHGGQALAVPYFQPGIGPTGARVPALVLLALYVDAAAVVTPSPGPHRPARVVAAPLREFLTTHLISSEGTLRDDDATRALLESVSGSTVDLWALDDLDQVPVGMIATPGVSSSSGAAGSTK